MDTMDATLNAANHIVTKAVESNGFGAGFAGYISAILLIALMVMLFFFGKNHFAHISNLETCIDKLSESIDELTKAVNNNVAATTQSSLQHIDVKNKLDNIMLFIPELKTVMSFCSKTKGQ